MRLDSKFVLMEKKMIPSMIISFIFKYWKSISSVIVLISIAIAVFFVYNKWQNMKQKISELENQVCTQEELLEEKDYQIQLTEKFIETLNEYEEKEKKSEHHYHEKIIHNEKVVKEYVEKKENPEEKKKYYEFLNKKWESLNDIKKLKNK